MTRRRAGHGWTAIHVGQQGRYVEVIQNDAGQWITTGEAQGWPRCSRCRKPFEPRAIAERGDLCDWCWTGSDLRWTAAMRVWSDARHLVTLAAMRKPHPQKIIDSAPPGVGWRTALRRAAGTDLRRAKTA